MGEWQDISTAPRDRFLVLDVSACEGESMRAVARWWPDRWYGIFEDGLTYDSEVYDMPPRRWIDLPPLPAQPKEAAE